MYTRKTLLIIIIVLVNFTVFSQTSDLMTGKTRKITIEKGNRITTIRVRRKWLAEKSFMIVLNATRIATLHQPMLGFGTIRLRKAAYLHSVDMGVNNFCSHKGFNNRSDQYHYKGENVAYGQKTWPGLYLGWFFSEGHRKNMYSWRYLFCGLAICKVITKTETYKNGILVKKERDVSYASTHVFR